MTTLQDKPDPVNHLIEECSELILALCKAERFGWFNCNPATPEKSNFEDVQWEMDDVVNAIERLQEVMRDVKHLHFKSSNKGEA